MGEPAARAWGTMLFIELELAMQIIDSSSSEELLAICLEESMK